MLGRRFRVAVVGGGVAGVYASQHLVREGIEDVVIIERGSVGGLVYYANCLENVPGFIGAEGREFASYLRFVVDKYEVPVLCDEILRIGKLGDGFYLEGVKGIYYADYVIVATGTKPRRLGIVGEEYHPEWISWDGVDVVVIGGGDVALDYAIRIRRGGGNVVVVYRSKVRGLECLRRVCEDEGVRFIRGEVEGYSLEGGRYRLVVSGSEVVCDKVVCAIGREPQLPVIELEYGDVRFPTGKTYIKGLYIVGSVVLGSYRQCMLCGGMGIAAGMDIASEVHMR